MAPERFTFINEGVTLVGHLYRPNAAAKGLAVTTGPLTSVKEQASGAYAHALVHHGYVALAFDHRFFGESGGRPRQFENPYAKADDINAAVLALKALPQFATLPVYGVGVCAGGGYMAKAVVSATHFDGFAGIAGVYPDRDRTRSWMGAGYDAAIARARAARERFIATGEAETIPAVGPDNGDVAMPLTEAYQYYGTARGQVPSYVNGFAVQSRLYTLDFDVQTLAADIVPPTLIVHSEHALMPALARAFYDKLKAPKSELWLQSQGQIDFYDDPRLISASVEAIDAFFTSHTP